MSNNKQSMKLYTEEQLKKAIELAQGCEHDGYYPVHFDYTEKEIIDELTPIELPSELTALNEHLGWLKQELQRVIDDGESESWVYAYKRAIKNAESTIKKHTHENNN